VGHGHIEEEVDDVITKHYFSFSHLVFEYEESSSGQVHK
jgi:hypothetical protein